MEKLKSCGEPNWTNVNNTNKKGVGEKKTCECVEFLEDSQIKQQSKQPRNFQPKPRRARVFISSPRRERNITICLLPLYESSLTVIKGEVRFSRFTVSGQKKIFFCRLFLLHTQKKNRRKRNNFFPRFPQKEQRIQALLVALGVCVYVCVCVRRVFA